MVYLLVTCISWLILKQHSTIQYNYSTRIFEGKGSDAKCTFSLNGCAMFYILNKYVPFYCLLRDSAICFKNRAKYFLSGVFEGTYFHIDK